jgi:cytidine deaminase
MDDRQLLEHARRAAAAAYAPYSGFAVGAAALARDGRIFTAANVENASYGLSLCAERAALARANAEGIPPGEVEALATTSAPCGACRQWLVEFAVDRILYPWQGTLVVAAPAELLPDSFRLEP